MFVHCPGFFLGKLLQYLGKVQIVIPGTEVPSFVVGSMPSSRVKVRIEGSGPIEIIV
jgi:hypothetical protein